MWDFNTEFCREKLIMHYLTVWNIDHSRFGGQIKEKIIHFIRKLTINKPQSNLHSGNTFPGPEGVPWIEVLQYMVITWILPNFFIANTYFSSLLTTHYIKAPLLQSFQLWLSCLWNIACVLLKLRYVKLCVVCRLFVEKLPLHPEYAKAPPIDKANNKKVSCFSSVNITCWWF